MSERISAVFDCMMFLQAAARSNSPAAACFDLVRLGHVELHISDEVIAEVRKVFTYPKFRARFTTLTDDMIEEFLAEMLSFSTLHRNVPSVFEFDRDPKDEKYVNLAHKADAVCIVTRDNDLLELMTGFDTASKIFRQKFRPLKILDPIRFLGHVRNYSRSGTGTTMETLVDDKLDLET